MPLHARLAANVRDRGTTRAKRYCASSYGSRHRSYNYTLDDVKSVKLENNTFAYLDGEDVIVRHFTTDIVRIRPDGLQVIETDCDSQTTRRRYKAYTSGWQVYTHAGQTLVSSGWHETCAFVYPLVEGFVVGEWRPTEEERLLCLWARLGNALAHERLCDVLAARGGPFEGMAQAMRRNAPRGRWGTKGNLRKLQATLHEALTTREADTRGLWWVNEASGVMVAALSVEDMLLGARAEIGWSRTVDGETHVLVDGFEYSARRVVA